jgi:dTDP-4-dehydrorhamnose 3,5-epimerase
VVADQVGRLTFTDELVRATRHLLDSGAAAGTYHVSNGGPAMSWAEIARAVFERSGRSADDVSTITTEAYAAGVLDQGNPFAPRPLRSAMSLDKIRSTGFEPEDALVALERYLVASERP